MAERLLVVVLADAGQHSLLVGFVLVSAGVDLTDQGVKVGVWTEGALRHQLLPACWTLLIPVNQRRYENYKVTMQIYSLKSV